MTEKQLLKLLQETYFNNIDSGQPEAAVKAFADDAVWQHTQVWAHDGHDSRTTDRLAGREKLLQFLQDRVPQMQTISITHTVDEVIIKDRRGAFRARVSGPDGGSKGFLGWVETDGEKLTSYIVVPEDFAA